MLFRKYEFEIKLNDSIECFNGSGGDFDMFGLVNDWWSCFVFVCCIVVKWEGVLLDGEGVERFWGKLMGFCLRFW